MLQLQTGRKMQDTIFGWDMKPPTPNPAPLTEISEWSHGNNLSMKINKFAFKRSMIAISKYPESFVKNEFVDLKKINNYCIVWVWNPLPQVNI